MVGRCARPRRCAPGATRRARRPGGAQGSSDDLAIKVPSNRADLISGGDALVEVVIPADADPPNVRVRLNGVDVTNLFGVRDNGRYIGLVDGLDVGDNELVAYVTSAP